MTDDKIFVTVFNAIANDVHDTACDKGWWDDCLVREYNDADGDHLAFIPTNRNFGEAVALIHSELSEGLEGMRHGNGPSEHIPEFNCVEEEFADVIIRIMDLSKANGWRIAEAILAKMQFNENRPVKHGGKAF